MDAELKRKWIEDLRSSKHNQAKGVLRASESPTRKGGFCCLGRLCDLIDPTGWVLHAEIENKYNHPLRMPGSDYVAPSACGLTLDQQKPYAIMNDGGKSFAEIADEIERNTSI